MINMCTCIIEAKSCCLSIVFSYSWTLIRVLYTLVLNSKLLLDKDVKNLKLTKSKRALNNKLRVAKTLKDII